MILSGFSGHRKIVGMQVSKYNALLAYSTYMLISLNAHSMGYLYIRIAMSTLSKTSRVELPLTTKIHKFSCFSAGSSMYTILQIYMKLYV